MLYTASVTDHLKFQKIMTFTHVLCKIVVTQNINDKIKTLYILKMSYRGFCNKRSSISLFFVESPEIQRMTFFTGNLGRN